MDRIRRALDLARLERSQGSELRLTDGASSPQLATPSAAAVDAHAHAAAPPAAPAAAPPAAPAAAPASTPGAVSASCTRVFAPAPEVLETNRILSPGTGGAAAAAFRMLRTQVIQRMDANGWRTLAIFSPGASDGKTTTAVNLAASLASARTHTALLVEFDFKRPTLAARFGLTPEFGSSDVIGGDARVHDSLYHPEGFERLVLMPARTTLDNSSELLAGPRSREVVSELRGRYPDRIVVFDLPPVLTADDALSFAPLIDCGLVVAAEGRTRRRDLVRTIELLRNTQIVGTVLNRAADSPPGY